MIRVNLGKSVPLATTGGGDLDGLELVSDSGSPDVQKQGAIRLVIIALFPLALYFHETQKIPELQAKLASKNSVLQSLTEKNLKAQGAVEEIKKFKEDQARLQKQIDTLEGLQKERLREVKILDNLQKDIPEKLWLSRLEFQDAKLMITGLTTNDTELTSFMESLSKSVFLKDVNLVKSSEEQAERGFLKRFEIVCTIDRPVVAPEVRR